MTIHEPIDTSNLTDDNLGEMVDNVRDIVAQGIKTKRK